MLCLECGRAVRQINVRHLRSCSSITVGEYRMRHPGADLMDPDVRKASGLPLDRNPNWRGGKTYRACTACGVAISRNARMTCGPCRSLQGTANPFFGKKHDEQTRARMSVSAKGRDPGTRYKLQPTSEALSEGRRRYWERIPKEERAFRLATFIEAGQRHNRRSARTAIEERVASLLTGLELKFVRNVQIGRYNVDFLVGETTIVECYGDYWHCNPSMFAPEQWNGSLRMFAKEK